MGETLLIFSFEFILLHSWEEYALLSCFIEDLYGDAHKWWAKQNLVTFFLTNVLAAVRGVGRGRFRGKAGSSSCLHTLPLPSLGNATNTLVYKKSHLILFGSSLMDITLRLVSIPLPLKTCPIFMEIP